MRTFLLWGALIVAYFVANHAVRAQDVPAAPTQAAPALPGAPNGADLLLQAGQLILPGPNGEPSASEKLAPDENLRRQRLAVARNAPALAKLREALKAGIELVPGYFYEAMPSGAAGKPRELVRQLWQEAAVRAADGDTLGAAQSALDSLELGRQIKRGAIINGLVGIALSSIGRKSLEKYAPALDAAQSRSVAERLEQINARTPAYADTLRGEEIYSLKSVRDTIAEANDPLNMAEAFAEMQAAEADEEYDGTMLELMATPEAEVEADVRSVYARLIARAQTPYFAAAQGEPVRGKLSFSNLTAGSATNIQFRLYSERDIVINRLWIAALRLRAAKLETGAYPAQFDAGTDPFSPTLAPLIYRRDGDKYLLYSVGPDGKDEGGAKIQTPVTDEETGAKSVSDRLAPESTGDIVAPVF